MSKSLVRIPEESKQKLDKLVKHNNEVIASPTQPKITQEVYLAMLIEAAYNRNEKAIQARGI